MIVYVSVGNSDDKLSQEAWANFLAAMKDHVAGLATTVHGSWYSAPTAVWQNACWCLEFVTAESMDVAKANAKEIRSAYDQESVAWAEATTEFI